MVNWKKITPYLVAACLTACRLEVTVTEGGAVASDSGNHDCGSAKTCSIEVADTNFQETFTAIPSAGYQFIGWEKGPSMLCGWSLAPCTIETSWFAGNDDLMAILDSDTQMYIQPQFIPTDSIRLYQPGDVVFLSGTMTLLEPGQAEKIVPVTARKSYLPGTSAVSGKNVLLVQSEVTILGSGETLVSAIEIAQNEKSALFNISDEYGNAYLTAPTNAYGLIAIPMPLVPHSSSVFNFYTLFGGNTSGPITNGSRSIQVIDVENVTSPMGEYQAYRIEHLESYEYLYTYADHKRGSSVRTRRQLWISPAKGEIRTIETRSEYSNTGVLQTQTTLELNVVRTSY
jgi:hypothetical protein